MITNYFNMYRCKNMFIYKKEIHMNILYMTKTICIVFTFHFHPIAIVVEYTNLKIECLQITLNLEYISFTRSVIISCSSILVRHLCECDHLYYIL